MAATDAYEEMVGRSKGRAVLSSCASVLGWDEQTYLPTAGSAHRGEQMAMLAGLVHERATAPRVGELLAELEASPLAREGDTPASANLREWRREYDRQTKLPRALVEELARVTSLAQQEWVEARRRSDFEALRPRLEEIVALKRDEADCLGFDDPYDALLDDYEPGATGRELAPLFEALRAGLVPLVAAIVESGRGPDAEILRRDY